MILVDVNLLLYATNPHYAEHSRAKAWWEARLNGTELGALSWHTLSSFIRIVTNPRVFQRPLQRQDAIQFVDEWLGVAVVRILEPKTQHWQTFRQLLMAGRSGPDLIADAYLAALAIDHDCELNSADEDFKDFSGLRWRNPLSDSPAAPAL